MTRRCWRVATGLPLLTLAAGVAQASPGQLGGGSDVAISIWRIIAAFLLCVAVAFAVVLVIRARGGGGGALLERLPNLKLPIRARKIEVVETRRLSPHADISLVRQGGREYLLLLQAGESRLLREAPIAEGEAQ